jgi:cellulose synthase/poly-beta-1,6-N-acetylglucosamine synthase-like glycosyltransferase
VSPSWTDLLLTAAALPPLGAASYLGLLAVIAQRTPPPPAPAELPRFDIVVPAHDEEPVVGATVRSLLAVDYPRQLFRVRVVADNCSDRTAEVAADAGAEVWQRIDRERRGKGYALAFAFERVLGDAWADAAVVVDADTLVSPNLLTACAARLARGERALQAEYGVSNADDSWRTRLMRLAFALFHDVRSLARERLGLSCGLRGNGMVFALDVLRRVPHDAFSIVEDLEYGLRLGRAGYRVAYVGEARVQGQMVAGERASRSQRRRWEGGRWLIARQQAPDLLARALRQRSPLLLDLALDLLVPPLTYVAVTIAVGLAACAAAFALGAAPFVAVGLWGAAALALLIYVGRGLTLSGLGLRGLADLAWAPVYIAWKLVLMLAPGAQRSGEWVRTSREGQ